MKSKILQKGEHVFKLSLESNAFNFLGLYDESINAKTFSFRELTVAFISLIGFYECFIKWRLTLDDRKTIVLNNKEISKEAFQSGNFGSISFEECLQEAEKIKLISSDDKTLVSQHYKIRNKIVHFAVTGEYVFSNLHRDPRYPLYCDPYCLKIKKDEFEKENAIISKLLKEQKNNLPKHLKLAEKRLLDKYSLI